MNEQLLHYIWQFTHFDVSALFTTKHLPISIYSVGKPNPNAGADFLNAKIGIDDLVWFGDVELHINSSDWNKHAHYKDKKYNSVILHVVWQEDKVIQNNNEEEIHCLELQPLVNHSLLGFYRQLMQSKSWILCQPYFKEVDEFIISQFTERLLIERMEEKSKALTAVFVKQNNNLESMFYQSLCHSLGLKINSTPMYYLSNQLPYKVLSKHRNNLFQIEALLFGVAGFLRDVDDSYGLSLKKEFSFLKHKYKLEEMDVDQWMFMRLRPSSFPTIRIAQLAQLIVNNTHFFSRVLQTNSIHDLRKIFKSSVSDYWLTHYHFKKTSVKRQKSIGVDLFKSIVINTVCPSLFMYAKEKGDEAFQEKSIRFLGEIKAEDNSVIRGFTKMGLRVTNAAQSQALLQLKRKYCEPKKCLNCNIGNDLIAKK